MMKNINFDDFQKLSQTNMDAAMKVFGEWNKGWQAIAAEMTDYTKKSFEESTATFEKLLTAKSLEQAIEIQSGFAKRAYDGLAACTPSSPRKPTSRSRRRYRACAKACLDGRRSPQAPTENQMSCATVDARAHALHTRLVRAPRVRAFFCRNCSFDTL